MGDALFFLDFPHTFTKSTQLAILKNINKTDVKIVINHWVARCRYQYRIARCAVGLHSDAHKVSLCGCKLSRFSAICFYEIKPEMQYVIATLWYRL